MSPISKATEGARTNERRRVSLLSSWSVRGFVVVLLVSFASLLQIGPFESSFLATRETFEATISSLADGVNLNAAKYLLTNEEASTSTDEPDEPDEPPYKPLNLVLLYADDWSYFTLGAAGNPYVKTPNLDRMAEKGIMFTRNCVTTSICMVSRATLYTGQYASRHKSLYVKDPPMLKNNWKAQTLYPRLLQAGYHVGFYGKWHHDHPNKTESFSNSNFYYGRHFYERAYVNRHVTEWNKIDGLEFLRNRPKNDSFALTISFFATHAMDGDVEQYFPDPASEPWYANDGDMTPPTNFGDFSRMPWFFIQSNRSNIARARFFNRYSNATQYQTMMRRTYRMASEVDAACGEILKELEDQGVLNETLVIFTTDNGNMHGQHGLAEKWYAFEESIRVPLIVMDPRMPKEKIGTRDDSFTLSIDLAPTLLRAAGVKPPRSMQGRDIGDLYLPKNRGFHKKWRPDFYYEWFSGHPINLPSCLALVTKEYKYIEWSDWNYAQLFHLPSDPHEDNDVINTTDPVIVRALKERFDILKKNAAAGVPM